MTHRISTEDVDEKHREDYWQAACRELIGSVELKDYARDAFQASIAVTSVGGLKFTRFRGVSQALVRDPSHIRSSDTDDYALLLETENRFVFDHNGHQRIGRGGMVFVDIARSYYSHHPDEMDVSHVLIPRQMLDRVFGSARQAAGLSIEPDQPSYHILLNFLRALKAQGARLDAASADRMSSVALELIAAGLIERIGAEPARATSSAAILSRAQSFIADKIGVAGLCMDDIAGALKISVRRLHQVAADEGVSLIDWMWDRRLHRARAVLADPGSRMLSVQTIALQCGFLDQAHFSRRFKQRFDETPTDFRASQSTFRLAAPGA